MIIRTVTMKTLRKSPLMRMRSKMLTMSNKETKKTRMRFSRVRKKVTMRSKTKIKKFPRMVKKKESMKTDTMRKNMCQKMARMLRKL